MEAQLVNRQHAFADGLPYLPVVYRITDTDIHNIYFPRYVSLAQAHMSQPGFTANS